MIKELKLVNVCNLLYSDVINQYMEDWPTFFVSDDSGGGAAPPVTDDGY